MEISKDRRKQVNAELNDNEKTQFRGLIGQMGWITRQSRPDLMVNVSMAAQSMGSPKIKDVVNLNKAVGQDAEGYLRRKMEIHAI